MYKTKTISNRSIIEHCSPTLAGLKTANLFSINLDNNEDFNQDFNQELRNLNHMLVKKGLRILPVQRTKKKALLYLYRQDYLSRDLMCPKAQAILSRKGYPCDNVELCIVCLIRHIRSDKTFPHEIGLFLGYPPSDVDAFMNSPWDGVKSTGCWKVYSNEAEAEKTFRRFKKCTEIYRKKLAEGMSLVQLTVANRRAS